MRVGSVHSAESKAKISESMKGNHNNPSWSKKSEPVAVRNVTTGESFYSLSAAAEAYDCSVTNIFNACAGYGGQQTAAGCSWAFI